MWHDLSNEKIPRPGELSQDTIVTYTLTARDGGTELQLTHTGFEGMRGAVTAFIMEKGWANSLKNVFSIF